MSFGGFSFKNSSSAFFLLCPLSGKKSGFSETPTTQELKPVVPDELIPDDFPVEKLESLKKILSFDPRPSYRNDDREYGFPFAGYEIKFRVVDNTATVTFIKKL